MVLGCNLASSRFVFFQESPISGSSLSDFCSMVNHELNKVYHTVYRIKQAVERKTLSTEGFNRSSKMAGIAMSSCVENLRLPRIQVDIGLTDP
jgi:hypothetical protein